MTRLEKAAEVRRLRDEHGLYWRQIGEQLGISKTYASALYHDPDGSKDKVRKASYGGTCLDCGKRTNGHDGRAAAPDRCSPCANRHMAKWSRGEIVAAIRRFAERYGRPPSATDFNPAHARSKGHGWRSERFYADGDYPTANTAVEVFGTWNAAIEAAGFDPVGRGCFKRVPGSRRSAQLESERTAA